MSDKRKEIEKRDREREDIQEDIKKLSKYSSLTANEMKFVDIQKLDVSQMTVNYLKNTHYLKLLIKQKIIKIIY